MLLSCKVKSNKAGEPNLKVLEIQFTHWLVRQIDWQPVLGAPDPEPAWLVMTVVFCFWDDPALWAAKLDDAVSAAFSATSILPPNWKLLVLTWDLLLWKVLVSHEHTSAAACSTLWVSGMAAMA